MIGGGGSEDEKVCPTCWGDFSEAPCAALLCGHAYHQDCLQMAMNAKGVSDVFEFQCPKCRQVGRDIELRASLAGPVGSGPPPSALLRPVAAGPDESGSPPGAPLSPEPGVSGAAAEGISPLPAPGQSPGAAPAPAAAAAEMSPAHITQVSQTQASPVPLTANGSPVPHLQDDDLGPLFQGLHQGGRLGCGARPDG